MQIPAIIPLLPIRNAVLFPGVSMPLVVGRAKSMGAVKEAQAQGGYMVVVTQRQASTDDPTSSDLYKVGTLCKIENVVGLEDNGLQVVVTGIARYKIKEFLSHSTYFAARGETVADDHGDDNIRRLALFHSLKDLAKEILALVPGAEEPLTRLIDKLDDPTHLTNLCAAYLNISITQKQKFLENVSIESRMEMLLDLMKKERELLRVQKEIRDKMSERMSKAQREAFLREQMRAIREELGEDEGAVKDDIADKLRNADMPDDVRKVAEKELSRLENLPQASAEYHVIRNYLDWLVEMPWKKASEDKIDLKKAREVLDEDHYGLEKVKKRILQYLAVAQLKNNLRGPILCLVGPPGVGKTSLGQSIARALGREFIRTSLGGVRDDSEVRGHRRTYVGAMPGRIAQSIKRAGVNNPVMMLDEIDKLGVSFQGDPAAAMLEVLDPEQNKAFLDHYLDVPFDLSNVFFVATANVIDTIPGPLRDRLEIIEISSYTTIEKLHIAETYLVPKQLKEHGLTAEQVKVTGEALEKIITYYTREAGVRELQRNVASVFRGAAEAIVSGEQTPLTITPERVVQILGPEKFYPEVTERITRPGVVTGLAWTPHGGDILFVEASTMPGTGQLKLTGHLGDVMKESAVIAQSLVREQMEKLSPKFKYNKQDIHVHVPSGAIPKDGPSAGVTIVTALASMLTGKTVDSQLAMTGEITLRGNVLPVGGIKEKVLAAHRAGCRTIILPKRNKPDLAEIPPDVVSQLKVHFVETIEELFEIVLGLPRVSESVLPPPPGGYVDQASVVN
ncbi:MAG TPA: endopeptidase La [Bdellovibrionales bacterium]|nr:endopeptidase La [Bdellovibrionales bacterium]